MPLFPHVLTSLLAITRFQAIFARHNGYQHEAVDASKQGPEKRGEPVFIQNYTITEQCPVATPARTIHSLVFPSPDASPVEVTAQSQVVTSFYPEMTWCVGPPIGLVPISASPPYANKSTEYETIVAGTGHCETVYVPTTTTVCATTLTGIASKITVSECDQEITFSSECGYNLQAPTPVTANLASITPAPTVQRMMTYWLAPWQSLTAGDAPSDVDIKVCKILDDDEMECTRTQEVWEVITITQTSTSSHEIALTTTVSGPGTLIIETMEVYVTDTIETVDLSTTLLLETEVEIESTSKGKKLVTRPDIDDGAQASTLYITKQLKYKTSQPTTTVRITSVATQNVGTITRTRARPRPTLPEMPDV
ncbi:hypothetical protein P280DRAFT_547649 [Massarina eburnea CBS 473.64]|uniref:Uncharacterized protein n=1 Tax=Massarina eburnea CBS 473.64 TaxID=1395130 RepID=A0A6A6S9D7_9PLEO|nr:hypothetical protein P280DRAFT_547649 [Massarina eburnea CBS 473.64]